MSRRTPGRWAIRGHQVRADEGRGQHVADYRTNVADELLLAAAPELLEMVLDAISRGEACGGDEGYARDAKERLARLGLVRLGLDEHGRESEKAELADVDPDVTTSWT